MTPLPPAPDPGAKQPACTGCFVARLLVSLSIVVGYYALRGPITEALNRWYSPLYERIWRTELPSGDSTVAVVLVTAVLLTLMVIWQRLLRTDPRFQAPLLITAILV